MIRIKKHKNVKSIKSDRNIKCTLYIKKENILKYVK